jgi:hypothetical protein
MFSVVRGSIAAAYPKAINAVYATGFNPSSAARRSYGDVGTALFPNYIDTPGWTAWPAGGPKPALAAAGYRLQIRYTMADFEAINGPFANHVYSLFIGSTDVHDQVNVSADTGYIDISPALAGAITFHDWLNNSNGIGGTAYVGNVTLLYQYLRS